MTLYELLRKVSEYVDMKSGDIILKVVHSGDLYDFSHMFLKECVQIVVKRDTIVFAGDADIVISIEIPFADDIYFVTFGVKSHLT